MKLKYQFMIQKVGDHYMAVDVSGDKSDFKGIIKLNETGKFIFECLKEDVSVDDLITKVMNEFNGNKEEVESGVREYCQTLQDKGLLL